MLEVPWLQEVDWQEWMDSPKALSEDHPTIARQVPANETINKLTNQKNSNLSEVRRLHRDVLSKLLIENREVIGRQTTIKFKRGPLTLPLILPNFHKESLPYYRLSS